MLVLHLFEYSYIIYTDTCNSPFHTTYIHQLHTITTRKHDTQQLHTPLQTQHIHTTNNVCVAMMHIQLPHIYRRTQLTFRHNIHAHTTHNYYNTSFERQLQKKEKNTK